MNKGDAENRGIAPDVFAGIQSGFDAQPCHQAMGLKITYLGQGIAGIKVIPDHDVSTAGGRLHGGVIATLADTVMGAAAATIEGQLYRTVEMKVNYLAPVFIEKELTAEGRVLHSGNTLAVVEGALYDHNRKLVLTSLGTFIKDSKYQPFAK